jgi:hypothetical protein
MSQTTFNPSDFEERSRQMIVEEVRKQTREAIFEREEKVLTEIKKAISSTVEDRYKVVVGEVGTHGKEKESRRWQITLAVLPVVLTIALGWWVTRAQTEITKTIDDQKQELTTRLALTQEYQKRKLDVYQECTKSASNLAQAVEALQMEPQDQKAVSDAVSGVYGCTQNNALYVTQEVANSMEKIQSDAIEIMQKAGRQPVNTAGLRNDVESAEHQMLEELTRATIPLSPQR